MLCETHFISVSRYDTHNNNNNSEVRVWMKAVVEEKDLEEMGGEGWQGCLMTERWEDKETGDECFCWISHSVSEKQYPHILSQPCKSCANRCYRQKFTIERRPIWKLTWTCCVTYVVSNQRHRPTFSLDVVLWHKRNS